jgi:hypothetical protein
VAAPRGFTAFLNYGNLRDKLRGVMERSSNPVVWWSVVWLLRLAIPGSLFIAWELYQSDEWLWLAGCVLALALTVQLQATAKQIALGWVIDETGERQMVSRWNDGYAIFTPTSRDARIIEAAEIRDRRRTILGIFLLGWMASAALTYYAWTQSYDFHDQFWINVFWTGATAGVLFAIGTAVQVTKETLYLWGWQYMKGARVIDAAPMRPGLDDVLLQKSHGDARLATEQEVQAAASGAPSRSPVHDQEF